MEFMPSLMGFFRSIADVPLFQWLADLQYWQQVLLSVVTLVTVNGIKASATWIKGLFTRLRFPIGGSYIYFFDHGIDSETKTPINPGSGKIELKQRGLKFTGYEEKNSDSQHHGWTLRGTIEREGKDARLSGTYDANSMDDKGIGAFFFEYNKTNGRTHLDGAWCGYDNTARKVTSGRYRLVKTVASTIIELDSRTEQHERKVQQCIEIAADVFGPGYLKASNLDQYIGGGNRRAIIATLDKSEKSLIRNQVLGFALIQQLEKDKIREFLKQKSDSGDKLPAIGLLNADKKGAIGILQTVAVREGFQQAGLGHDLVAKSLKLLKQMNITIALAPAWKAPFGTPADGVLQKHGFRPVFDYPDFWKSDCESSSFNCKARNENLCACAMKLFALVIK